MKKVSMAIGAVILLVMAAACGSNVSHGLNVTIAPTDGAIDQTLDVAITAVFSSNIAEPLDWNTSFTLKKGGAGDNLCTAITYSSSATTAYCAHDALEASTTYQVEITAVTAVNGKVVNFTTVAAPAADVLETTEPPADGDVEAIEPPADEESE